MRSEEIILQLEAAGEFEIRPDGTIWRLKVRRGNITLPCPPRRAEHRTPHGYLQVRAMVGCRRYHVGAHRVIWWKFRGPIPDGMVINHINGQKDDNRLENLELVTPSGNAMHAHRTGLRDQHGERNPAAKLTDHEVAQIRLAYASGGFTQAELARKYGVSFQHISKLVRGQRRKKQAGPVADRDHRYCACERDPITGRFVGKIRAAGALLDGREWREWPEVAVR